MLDWHGSRHVGHGDEPPRQGVHFDRRERGADFRELLAIPAGYKVLFLQGGATAQFAMVPMNLLRGKKKADYIHTGEWAKKAIGEAKKFCGVNVAASSEDRNFTYVPKQSAWKLDPAGGLCALHRQRDHRRGRVPLDSARPATCRWCAICLVQPAVASAGREPLRADLCRRAEEYRARGLTIVIVREDLIGHAPAGHAVDVRLQDPGRQRFDVQHAADLRDLHRRAGVPVAAKQGRPGRDGEDQHRKGRACCTTCSMPSGFYRSPVAKDDRSRMNVPFTLRDPALDEEFLKEAAKNGLLQLRATARSAGCARRSTTRCRSKA